MASAEDGLSVIALVSGGKDSFFSILHCLANGHRVVALANLHPGPPRKGEDASLAGASSPAATATDTSQALAPAEAAAVTVSLPAEDRAQSHGRGHGNTDPRLVYHPGPQAAHEEEEDPNSFMYQTVGHQVIPLYAEATGIPLYRHAIVGGAGHHGKDYSHSASPEGSEAADETESMVPLLRAAMAAHPEANAICAGAILSTYQRTRVESVAIRLGLVPLAFLWKFPSLPVPTTPVSDAQLLDDMAAVGLEARLIKVASGGLDDSFLWTNVASAAGKEKVARSMRRFGTAEKGAVIGEGGEFETLVLDGPSELFKKRIVVGEEDKRVVKEGGGTSWLSFRGAHVEDKEEDLSASGKVNQVRIPHLLDARFASVLDTLSASETEKISSLDLATPHVDQPQGDIPNLGSLQPPKDQKLHQWTFTGEPSTRATSVVAETTSIVDQIRHRLEISSLTPSSIINSTIVLRRMADFPAINAVYGALFSTPNPPSRVTISCGDLVLPSDANITVSLAVHSHLQRDQRQGLHVQSRSYWAPANIGPYSQAISIPLASLASSSSGGGAAKLVSIAGQIPLIPASMALPPSPESIHLQLVLSLQHLWRIGVEMNVGWWTSAVAYIPRQLSSDDIRLRVKLAYRAWKSSHLWSASKSKGGDDDGDDSDQDSDDGGPDIWDKRFNTQYMELAGAGEGEQKLPDWNKVTPNKKSRRAAAIPPLFVAEVEELPRGAGAEWHAHLGVAGGEVVVFKEEERDELSISQTVIREEENGVSAVVGVVSERFEGVSSPSRLDQLAREGVSQFGRNASDDGSFPVAMVRYIDAGVYGDIATKQGEGDIPFVPCRSLWDTATGERLASVVVYRGVFEKDVGR